jgi:hypothetical protein
MKYDFDAVIKHLQETIEADRKSFDEYVDACEKELQLLQLTQL